MSVSRKEKKLYRYYSRDEQKKAMLRAVSQTQKALGSIYMKCLDKVNP